MKTTAYLASDLSNFYQSTEQTGCHPPEPNQSPDDEPPTLPTPLIPLNAEGRPHRESLRHILLGSPDAIEQTIHLLYRLNYAEPGLWSPIAAVGDRLIITAAQGEAISLLRRSL
ncbi:hypothetical protein [Leptolyngbya sp. BC1307]|uniref:hypothetical protein n=1 Tax=Leptolyngbya sp. BC1307 TaxID=2029589 RepID=UPI001F0AFA28|nr:hypothetical protein [Leptolyngbya sp. BC1307]